MISNRLAFAFVAALLAPAILTAQIPRSSEPVNRAPDKNPTKILILTFGSADSGYRATLGHKAAAEMRAQVATAFSVKELYVIPDTPPITMETSQFPPKEPLAPWDARAFAGMQRAEEYVMGSIERTRDGKVRARADLMLTRNMDAKQPLGVAESRSMPDAIRTLVREMKEARKQMAGEKMCDNAYREGLFSEAIQFARSAIAEYPKSTIARMCLLSALNASKAPRDSALKVAREILALDSRNRTALRPLPDDERSKYRPDSLISDTTRPKQLRDPAQPRLDPNIH